jgi:single-strand DNA-binding protein
MNKHLIAGNVGQEPEIRTTESGLKIANFSIAANEYRKNKETGEKEESTTWLKIVAFGKLAELVFGYVHKGSKLLVVGKVKNREYLDKDGNKRFFTETIADEIEFLSAKIQNQEESQIQTNNNPKTQIESEFLTDDLPF